MAGLKATEVRVAGSGAIWKAPTGTALPVDEAAPWGVGFVNLGFQEDGFKIKQDLKTNDLPAWQTLEPVRILVESLTRTLSFTALQSNKDTVGLAWGGAAIVPGTAGKYTLNLPDPSVVPEFVIGMDWNDGVTTQRIVIPRAALVTLPELTFGRKDAVKYSLEFRALAPATGSSVLVYGNDAAVTA